MDQQRSSERCFGFPSPFLPLIFTFALVIGSGVYIYVRTAPERAAQEQRQQMEQAQAAESGRLLSKCQDLFPIASGAQAELPLEACISLVIDYRISKPADICHAMDGVEDLKSCLSGFKVAGAAEACRSMIDDPDLAPSCENVLNHP